MPARAVTALAAALPDITALSMVAGSPVWIQSPARNRFLIGVAVVGRLISESGSGAIVACFSLSTSDLTIFAARALGLGPAGSHMADAGQLSSDGATRPRAPQSPQLKYAESRCASWRES